MEANRPNVKATARPATAAAEFRAGWPVILGAMICYACSVVALPAYLNGVFLLELERTFGWSRTLISLGSTIQLGALALMAPVAGYLADRVGIRLPMAISLLGIVITYVCLGLFVNSAVSFILLQTMLSIVGAATLPVVFTRAVNSWFDRARGMALGITLVGTGLTATFGPAFVTWCIIHYGWRSGYFAIAAVVLLFSPLILLLVRMAPWEARRDEISTSEDDRPGFDQAIRGRLFWILAAAIFLLAFVTLGMVGHLLPLLVDKGFDRIKAAEMAALVGVAVIGGRFIVGALMDRIFAPWVAVAVVAISFGGCVILAWGGTALVPIGVLAIGFSVGAEVDVISFLTSRYYASDAYSRIYGLFYAIFLGGGALSPLWIASLYDSSGSYSQPIFISLIMLAIGAVLWLLLPRYPSPSSTAALDEQFA